MGCSCRSFSYWFEQTTQSSAFGTYGWRMPDKSWSGRPTTRHRERSATGAWRTAFGLTATSLFINSFTSPRTSPTAAYGEVRGEVKEFMNRLVAVSPKVDLHAPVADFSRCLVVGRPLHDLSAVIDGA